MNGKVSTVIEPFTVNDVTGGLWTVNWKAINRTGTISEVLVSFRRTAEMKVVC